MVEVPTGPVAQRYRRAVTDLTGDRRRGLQELRACFHDGGPAGRPEGSHAGRLLATTIGYGLDGVFEALGRLWLPWRGKTFDPATSSGRNTFTGGFRVPQRMMWPGYRDEHPAGPGRFTTFPFSTWSGPSAIDPRVRVFKIDYAIPESPAFLVSSILDEVVAMEDGLLLGQALLRWRGEYRHLAWFELSAPRGTRS
jgi:hypothetical protein